MKKCFLILSLSLFFAVVNYAQSVTIQGILVDTLQEPLMSATVVLLNPQDSTMEYFAITNMQGHYKLKGVKRGTYLFQASYVGFESRFKPLELDHVDNVLQMGFYMLRPKSKLLGEVTVKADKIPILIKKDTVEYNAGSFKVKPNAAVEDLLKKLPGVEVEKDGTIKAHGEEVQSVKVDGKDFFGDDPTIATKNLPADAVDKVQVYDKKSEIAEFTGVDDGVRDKTINLKLKDGKKKGYFGNVSGGYGTDNRFESKANVNRFNKKTQLSFLGRMNNINERGFSFNDYLTFSGGFQNVLSEFGGRGNELMIDGSSGSVPFDMGQPNFGFSQSGSAGLNFNHDFSDRTEFSSSYFYSRFKQTQERKTFRQNFLEEAIFPSEQLEDQTSTNDNHRVSLKLKSKLDTNQILTLRGNFRMNDRFFQSRLHHQIYNVDNVLENSSWSNNAFDDQNWNANTRLTYLLKFKKPGRSLTADVNAGIQNSERVEDLEAINSFGLATPGGGFTDSLLQLQDQDGNQLDYAARFSYTEPIGKREYLQFRYERRNYTNELTRNVFDIQNENRTLNTLLSNRYNRDYYYDQGGLTFKLNRKKWIFSTGAALQYSHLKGEIDNVDDPIEQDFFAVLPSLSFNYDFTNSHSLSLNYRTNIREPSLEQLQPLVDNTNPLNLYVGNPDLKPEYNHRMDLRYMLFDQFNFRSFFASVNTTFTENQITNARFIDSLFIQTTQPVNVKSAWASQGYVDFGTPLKFMRSKMNLGINGQFSRGILFLNGIENEADRWNTSVDFSIENRQKDIIDVLLGVTWGYNQATYSEAKSFDQRFSSINYYTDWTLTLKKDWTITTSFDYTLYQGDDFGNQRQVPRWTASVSKPILKSRGTLELSARDILNQGIGIDRRSTLNYIEDVEVNSLGRFFMLTFSYSLTVLGDQTRGGIFIDGGRRRH